MKREEFIYLIPYFLSLAISLGIFIYAWRRQTVAGARPFAWLAATQAVWTFGFILELIAPTLNGKLFWDAFQWVGGILIPLIFPAFTIAYANFQIKRPRLVWGSLAVFPLILFILVLTSGYHKLLYPNPHLVPGEPFSSLDYDFTALFWVSSLYVYAIIIGCMIVLIQKFGRSFPLYRSQVFIIAVGAAFPILVTFLPLIGINITPQRDPTPFTFAIGNLIIGVGLFQYRLLDLVPIARERVLEDMTDAIIVLDASNRVVDMNHAALANVGKTSPEVIGHTAQEVFAEWPELREQTQNLDDAVLEVSAMVRGEHRIYDLSVSSIRDQRNRLIGRVFVSHDITARKMLEERYRLLSEELEQRVLERTENLRVSESRLQAAIDAADIGFWDWDLASGKVVSLGHHDKLFGFAPGEFNGTYPEFENRVHPEDLEELKRVIQIARDEGSEYAHEYRVVWPDGTIHWLAGRGRFEYSASGEPVRMRGAVLDITDRKQTEEQVSLLQTILMDVSAARDLSSTLWVVLRRVCEKTGWAYGQAWLPRPDGSVLDCGPAWFSDPSFEKFRAISQQTTFLPDKGLPGRVWLSKQPAWLENATLDPNFPRVESAAQAGLRAAFALPIIMESEIVAVLEFFMREPRAEDKRLEKVIWAVAAQLGLVIERRQAEEEIRQHAARMETLAEISQALAEVGLELQAVFDTIARYTAEHIGDSCAIRLLSSDEQRLNLVAFHHPVPETAALLKPAYLTPMPADQEWFRKLLQTGQSVLLPVITEEQIDALLPAEFRRVAERFRLHSGLIVPLRTEGRVIGTIALTRVDPKGPSYTPNDQVLLQELADRAGLTIQNARFFEQVEDSRERLEALSRRLLEAQESERRALTRELHDRVGQNLTGLSINLQNMKALLSRRVALALSAKFDDAQALVEHITRQIRDIMAELHLPELEYYGLAAALEIYAERAAARGNLEMITYLPDLAPPPLPSNICIAFFRAAQEAINNILKHADARHLELRLEEQNGKICLKIKDDGQGFQPDLVSQKESQTWGLKIMRERIEAVGGKVQIESEPGRGTQVIFETERPL